MNEQHRKAWLELGEILVPIAMRNWLAEVHFYSYESPSGDRFIEFALDHLVRCDKGTFTEVHTADVQDSLDKLGYLSDEGYDMECARAMVKRAMELDAEDGRK